MDISKRLKTIASLVPINSVVADIGTDHGYIPIYLIKNKIAKKVIACDVNPMPLGRAKLNIKNENLTHKIETRLGSGLSQIKELEVDTAIIAGMGGPLIIDILRDSKSIVKDIGLLILQPQSDIDKVRHYLHNIGFLIYDEQIVLDNGKFYNIIIAKPGKEEAYSKLEYAYGKKNIENQDRVFKDYLLHKIEELSKIKIKLSANKNENTLVKLDEINSEIKLCKGLLECQ